MSSITLNDFTRLAGQADDSRLDTTFLKVRGARLAETGRLGNFFTTHATRRASVSAFVDTLRAEYGDHVANMIYADPELSPQLKAGRPLTARLVRDAVSTAGAAKERIATHNRETVQTFVDSVDLADSVNKLLRAQNGDAGIDAYFDDSDSQALRFRIMDFLRDKAQKNGFYPAILNHKALRDNIASGLPGYTGLSPAHLTVLKRGLPGSLHARLRLAGNVMGLGGKSPVAFSRAMAHPSLLRGYITNMQQVYREMFQEDPPHDLDDAALCEMIETRCEQEKQDLQNRTGAHKKDIDLWAAHMPWDRLVRLLEKPDTVTRDDVRGMFDAAMRDMPLGSKDLATDPSRALGSCLHPDPSQVGVGRQPAAAFSFRLDDGKGGTATETITVGPETDFSFTDGEDKQAYMQGKDNSLAQSLDSFVGRLCAGSENGTQLRAGVMFCLSSDALLPLKNAAPLIGADALNRSAVSVSLSRAADGSGGVLAEFSSPPEGDGQSQFRMTLSISNDGDIRMENFALLPDLRIRDLDAYLIEEETRDDRRQAAKDLCRLEGRLEDWLTGPGPNGSPHGLLAQIEERVRRRDPEALFQPQRWDTLADRIASRIEDAMRKNALPVPLTDEARAAMLAIRRSEADAFFSRLDSTAQLVPPEQRAVFTRFCLERGVVPDEAMLPVSLEAAQKVTDAFGKILSARDGDEAGSRLDELSEYLYSVTYDNPDVRGKNYDFVAAMGLSMRLGILDLMGKNTPQGFAISFTRPGPFRDMLQGAREHAASWYKTRYALNWFGHGLINILPEGALPPLEGPNIPERELSLPRQREILGQGVYVARGAGVASPELAALNQNLARDMPAMENFIRSTAEKYLREGPPRDHRMQNGLSELFSQDYERDGVFVNGRYYNPGERYGNSEDDFIRLFPDARTAGLLSNLANQSLYLSALTATREAASERTFTLLRQADFGVAYHDAPAGQQNMRIETLDAAQGRYRLSAFHCIPAPEDNPAIERGMYEVTVDVNLGPPLNIAEAHRRPPSVENVHLDLLIRGREVVPGEA